MSGPEGETGDAPWLRPATSSDLDALAEIHAEAFDHPWSAASLGETLAGLGSAGLAAGRGGRMLGFLLLRTMAGEAEVLTLAVRPEARRRGLALALVEAAAGLAATAGAESFWLEVAADNPGATALYQRAGFVVEGVRPRYYARPDGGSVDALLMRRPLNSRPG